MHPGSVLMLTTGVLLTSLLLSQVCLRSHLFPAQEKQV